MTYVDLFQQAGIHRSIDLARALGIKPQAAHRIWIGQRGLGRVMILRIHERLGIDLEVLLRAEKPRHTVRPRRRPRKRPPDAPRAD